MEKGKGKAKADNSNPKKQEIQQNVDKNTTASSSRNVKSANRQDTRGDFNNNNNRGPHSDRPERRSGNDNNYENRPKTAERLAYEAKVKPIREEIDKCRAQLEQITEQIKSGSVKKDPQEEKARGAFDECKARIKEIRDEKNNLQQEVAALIEDRNELRQRVQELTNNLQFKKLDDVDRQISKLDNYLTSNSLNTQEEKKVLGQIRSLKNSRARVEEYVQCSERMAELSNEIGTFLEQVKEKQAALASARTAADVAMEKLKQIREKNSASKESVDNMFSRRRELSEKMRGLKEKLVQAKEEYEKQLEESRERRAREREAERLKIKQQREEEKKRREEERERRRKQREEEERRKLEKPYEEEIDMCSKLIAHFEKSLSRAARDVLQKSQEASTPASPSTPKPSNKVASELLNQLKAKQGSSRPSNNNNNNNNNNNSSSSSSNNNNNSNKDVAFLLHHVIPLTSSKKKRGKAGGIDMSQLDMVIRKDEAQKKEAKKQEAQKQDAQKQEAQPTQEEKKEENQPEAQVNADDTKQDVVPAEPAKPPKKIRKAVLSYGQIRMLGDLEVSVPSTEDDIPQTVQDLYAKKKFYESYKVGDEIIKAGRKIKPAQAPPAAEADVATEADAKAKAIDTNTEANANVTVEDGNDVDAHVDADTGVGANTDANNKVADTPADSTATNEESSSQ